MLAEKKMRLYLIAERYFSRLRTADPTRAYAVYLFIRMRKRAVRVNVRYVYVCVCVVYRVRTHASLSENRVRERACVHDVLN